MKTKLPVFYENDFPNMASHKNQSDCGFSIYRGVLVQWDEDQDERVLQLLDELPAWVVDRVLVVQEHEGTVEFLCKTKVPQPIKPGTTVHVGDDVWCVESLSIPNK